MRKAKILACVFLVGALGLSGCEEAPDPVSDNSTGLESGGSVEESKADEKTAEKYVSLEEAKAQVEQLRGQTISGFTFSKKFEMPDIDSVSVLKLDGSYVVDLETVEDAVSNIWSDYSKTDWSKIEAREFTHPDYEDYLGISKEDEENGIGFSMDTNGFFCGNSDNGSDLDLTNCKKKYDFLIGDNPEEVKNDEYELRNGKITVGEAVAYVEDKLNKYLAPTENNMFEYKVQKLYALYDSDTGLYELSMVFGYVYNGLPLTTVGDFYMGRASICYDRIHCGEHGYIRMRSVDTIDDINKCNEGIVIEDTETQDKIISPMWAVEQMEEQIANEGGSSYGYCGLVYIITQENWQYGENKQPSYSGPQFGETYIRPYWMFGNKSNSENKAYDDILGETVLVDAIDGALYFYDSTAGYAP